MRKASYFVSEMARKYGARRHWVWEVLEAELNIFKGLGCFLSPEEWDDMEEVITSGLNGEW